MHRDDRVLPAGTDDLLREQVGRHGQHLEDGRPAGGRADVLPAVALEGGGGHGDDGGGARPRAEAWACRLVRRLAPRCGGKAVSGAGSTGDLREGLLEVLALYDEHRGGFHGRGGEGLAHGASEVLRAEEAAAVDGLPGAVVVEGDLDHAEDHGHHGRVLRDHALEDDLPRLKGLHRGQPPHGRDHALRYRLERLQLPEVLQSL
mmetsp:Transcript_49089/g.142247  ORF Transcript_49089/g.142247 Transcript_49089/m.142247 type:complete len:204 (-) Transcript_49089:925-1536(-)